MSKSILEYEFRLSVLDPNAFELLEIQHRPKKTYKVVYAKPHFRYKNNRWEFKKTLSRTAVYHDGVWFRWVKSKEIPFRNWPRSLYSKFVDTVGFLQNPFVIEYRIEMELDSQAKIVAYRKEKEIGLLFEYETTCANIDVSPLSRYMDFVKCFFTNKPFPPYTLKTCTRKPVKPIKGKGSNNCLVARKFDGVFGFVYSHPDKLFETWEGNVQIVKQGVSLGDGIVFSAEKLENTIVLLDVYQVRGIPTAHKKSIFLEFLPRLELPSGFQIQRYYRNVHQLPPTPLKTDGLIFHDIENDKIFKWKKKHTVDLVYWDGYFLLPDHQRFPYTKERLENGRVYEVSMKGRVISKRVDRFVGNSAKQWDNISKCGKVWKGPPFEPREEIIKKTRAKRLRKN